MTDTFRTLCEKVLRYNNGEAPYNFSQLKPYDRDNAAFDAWQSIREEIRAALADHVPDAGNESQPPADGEVAELVAWLHGQDGGREERAIYSRIANLLKRLSVGPAVQGREPTPVSERPSDDELAAIYHDSCRGCEFMDQGGFEDGARAALARWGSRGVSRCHRLQQENHRFREPERTILCDILANGCLLPDADGKRYGIAAPRPPADGEVGISAEQQARDILERMGVPDAQDYAASDLIELANLIAAHALPLPSGEGE